MIKKFGFRNYFGFKEGAMISFELNSSARKSVYNINRASTVLGIKGANGSGKTNIIRALGFLSSFVTASANKEKDDLIEIDSYFNNKYKSDFFIEFVGKKNISYRYELSANRQEVFEEKISRKNERWTKIIHRKGEDVSCINELKEIEMVKVKNNASIISSCTKIKFISDIEDVVEINRFFIKIITNVGYAGLNDAFDHVDVRRITETYYSDPKLFGFVKEFIKNSDTGVKDIIIKLTRGEKGEEVYFPLFVHEYKGVDKFISYVDESKGTQKIYNLMYLYMWSLEQGGVLALDEFDIHLHSFILPNIIGLFSCYKHNKNNAQFIFTAHNTEIMDELGKYRTILVNKEDNESFCYRLDEIQDSSVRNDVKISKMYLEKRLGGYPKVSKICAE